MASPRCAGLIAVLAALLLAACASPAPFYYCVEVQLNKGDRTISALECIPRAAKVPWGKGAQGRELFE